MSFKRILIKILMMLLLWGALFAMFNLTQNVHPWIRVALGIGICIVYVVAQVAINRRSYGYTDKDKNQNKQDMH